MYYHSTRDKSVQIASCEAIIKGLAPDGGLFVPDGIPCLSEEEIASLPEKSYTERAVQILGKFLTDYSEKELADCVAKAYTKEKFGTDTIAPVYKLGDSQYILELWHGPTCAFKDMALQILPHLLVTAMRKTGVKKEIVILVATSGDTGKAALEGFADVAGTRISVFYPQDGVSKVQKLQMVTQKGNNVNVTGVNGNFDDAQTGVKQIFTDGEFARLAGNHSFMLSSANSINWGRLVPQIVYYWSAYAEMCKAGEITMGDKVNIVVPTGNFGNILAAYYASKMGLPVHKFICASNCNNVLTDFIQTGVYDKNRDFHCTISPSMDILISSNLERLLHHASGGNAEETAAYMKELSESGRYEVSGTIKKFLKENFSAGYADDAETKETIRRVFEQDGYIMDTHTAVAKSVYDKYVEETGDKTKTILASTASPFKFSTSVMEALNGDGSDVFGKDEFDVLAELSNKTGLKIPASLAKLKDETILFDVTCEKEDMEQVVKDFLRM